MCYYLKNKKHNTYINYKSEDVYEMKNAYGFTSYEEAIRYLPVGYIVVDENNNIVGE